MEDATIRAAGAVDWAVTPIVFYCEFSSERGPRMFRHIRNLDRHMHLAAYPALAVPHMYVLAGGYKAFQVQFYSLFARSDYQGVVAVLLGVGTSKAIRVESPSTWGFCELTGAAPAAVHAQRRICAHGGQALRLAAQAAAQPQQGGLVPEGHPEKDRPAAPGRQSIAAAAAPPSYTAARNTLALACLLAWPRHHERTPFCIRAAASMLLGLKQGAGLCGALLQQC